MSGGGLSTTRRMKMVDWNKPIRFENGESCVLVETYPDGYKLFPQCTRCVLRDGVTPIEAAYWWFPEDGKSTYPGYSIVNFEKNL